MEETARLDDRYLDQPYELSGRLIDPIGGWVTYAGERNPLKRKHLEVLACLASAAQAMVSRAALIDRVWNGNALVGDTGLTNAVYYLRRALHDTDADTPLIRTIPRRGYQLTVQARLSDRTAIASFSPGSSVAGKPDWHLLRLLGSSPVSETWLAEEQGSRAQRVFRFCRSEQHLRLLRREITVMRYLREALAARKDTAIVLDWQLDEPPYSLEMDYAAHGTLMQWSASRGGLDKVARSRRMRLIGEVAGALAVVHAVGVVHRNVSAASILIDDDHDNDRVHARLGEFGWSDVTDRSQLASMKITSAGLTLIGDEGAGEQRYLAPECMAGQAATSASDVHALGVLLLQMVVGDLQRTVDADWEGDVESEPLRALIAACTDAHAERRPSAADVARTLQDIGADAATERPAVADNVDKTPEEQTAQGPSDPAAYAAIAFGGLRSMIGQTIGPYHILDQLGEGGMGLVYLAEQTEPVQRKVALKLIKSGMDSKQVLARFEAERQALALMNHANVATVYDAGSTASREPYFAMEYVRGLDIDAHCDQLALDVRERITLFLQACEGVLHAHQKGLIHRDLKPGNILVSRAQDQPAMVKIIDFGVAKSLSGVLTGHAAHTRLGSFVGTPAYSSPEQVSGPLVNVDTRADIYSLGVVLYQLLAGVTPYSEEELNRKTPVELARLLSAERPPSLLTRFSSLSADDESDIARHRSLSVDQMKALLGSDLSWIVGKCLQRDPDDRYPSVLELEKDLRRWLDDEPIEARPASRMYRVRKFVRRHRVGVILASLVTLTLLTTTTAAVIGFVRAENALKAARRATAEAEMTADFQVKRMQSIDPAMMALGMRSALFVAVQEQGPGRGGDPASAALRRQQQESLLKGVNFTDMALSQLQIHSFQPALAIIEKDFGKYPLLQARLWQTMADTLFDLGDLKAAVEPQRLALEQRRRMLGADHPLTLVSLYGRGWLGCEMTRYNAGEADLRAATTGLRRVLGSDHPDTLRSISATGYCLMYQGKYDVAEPLFREAYERRRRTLGPNHPDTLASARDLAHALSTFGKHKNALPYAETAVNGLRRVLGEVQSSSDRDMLVAKDTLATTYLNLGRFAESEALSREAVEASRRLLGDKHPITSGFNSNLGHSLIAQQRPAEAEIYYRHALEGRRAVFGENNEDVLYSRANLAKVLAQQGKKDEAEKMLREVIADHRRLFGEGHLNTSDFFYDLAMVLRRQGKFEEAEALLTQVLAQWRDSLGKENRYTLQAMYRLATLWREKGDIGEAKSMLEETLKTQRRALGPQDLDTLDSLHELASMTRAEGDLVRAETLMREALSGFRQTLGDEHAYTLATIEQLIDVLRRRGALDEAAAFDSALKNSRQRLSKAEERPD
jgi:serine/threonine protein kinase/DNA-binding winged helix-turn-helix (wHTH) protein/tetratricopeptide (TPR) repeat protein